jgi:hypothetical protein
MEVIPDSAEVAGASPTLLVVQDLVQALSANGRALQAVEDGALPIQEISGFVEALKVWWEGADVPVSELGDLLRLEPRYTLEVDPTFDVLLYFSDMCGAIQKLWKGALFAVDGDFAARPLPLFRNVQPRLHHIA